MLYILALTAYGRGYYLACVWCFMTWKWGFMLFFFARQYRQLYQRKTGRSPNVKYEEIWSTKNILVTVFIKRLKRVVMTKCLYLWCKFRKKFLLFICIWLPQSQLAKKHELFRREFTWDYDFEMYLNMIQKQLSFNIIFILSPLQSTWLIL